MPHTLQVIIKCQNFSISVSIACIRPEEKRKGVSECVCEREVVKQTDRNSEKAKGKDP